MNPQDAMNWLDVIERLLKLWELWLGSLAVAAATYAALKQRWAARNAIDALNVCTSAIETLDAKNVKSKIAEDHEKLDNGPYNALVDSIEIARARESEIVGQP